MRYIQGTDRQQTTMLPPVVDDFVQADNPVRFIDYFVDTHLNLVELGFTYSEPKITGRMPYNPADLLKLFIYGYLNRIRSSRQLEKETHQNVVLMWLMRMLHPDFKTIADFRKNNKKAIREVCRTFTLLCRDLGLFDLEFFAIDGSKFAAVAHKSKAFTKDKLQKLIRAIDEQVDAYLESIEQEDDKEQEVQKATAEELQQKIDALRQSRQVYETYHQMLEESGETQMVLSDSDSRLMRTGHNGRDVCYNAQIAVDKKHKLIADHEVTNAPNDIRQLKNMAQQIKTTFNLDHFECAADAGYFHKDDIKECLDENIACYVPEPQKSKNRKKGKYTKKEFPYNAAEDSYICPAGQQMINSGSMVKHGRKEFIYKTSACRDCPLKPKCTTAKEGRRIYRWEHERVIEDMQHQLDDNPQYMYDRRTMAEHPFGTLKRAFGHSYFLCRGLEMVNTEMSLSVLAYNMRRVINILGIKELMTA